MGVRTLKGGAGASWALGAAGLACLSALSACSGDDEHAGPTKTEPALTFGDCPSDLPGSTQGRQCAVTQVPLRWDEPDGKTIELLVARYRSSTPNKGQLWMLDGGPGGTGAVYMLDQVLPLYASLGLDVYVPQHRGTGHSTPLDCDAKEDLHACGEELLGVWGDGLQGFHSVEAAHDVGHLIERSRPSGAPVFVFGLSYGSYWAQRYMQAFPAQAEGVILEGVFPLYQPLWEGDVPSDAAARSLFVPCRENSDCAAAFGSEDPEDATRAVLAQADDASARCLGDDGADRITLEGVFSLLIVGEGAQFVPGLVRRLRRCSAQDQKELVAFAYFIASAASAEVDPAIDNGVLGSHVLRTDLMASLTTFPLAERLAAREPLLFWSGAAPTEEFDAVVEAWPVNYPPASTELPASLPPVLMLNGGLDIQTPSVWAEGLAPKLGATLVEFPYAGHGVDISLSSPVTANDASCSLGMLQSFVDDPHAAIDGSCAATAYTPDVAGTTEVSQYLASAIYGDGATLLGDDGSAPQPRRIYPQSRNETLAAAETAFRQRLARAARDLRGY